MEQPLSYTVEYSRKKNSSATIKDGQIIIRVSSLLPKKIQEQHVSVLLEKISKKLQKKRGLLSLMQQVIQCSEVTFFNGTTYVIHMTLGKRTTFTLKNDTILIRTPLARGCVVPTSLRDVYDEGHFTVAELKKLLLQFAKKHLLDEVTQIVHEWESYMQPKKKVTEVKLSTMDTRWGTCSSRGVITIALKTLLLPEEIFESVCVHEVAHLDEMNHSKHFWELVLGVMPQYKKLQKKLKNYH